MRFVGLLELIQILKKKNVKERAPQEK